MDNITKEASPTTSASGLKRVFSRANRSRTTLSEPEGSTTSVDSIQEKSRPTTTGETGQDGVPSGISKLIPGARRRLRKKNEQEASADNDEGSHRGRILGSDGAPATVNGRSRSRSKTDPANNPLTDDSESDAYSHLTSHDSNVEYMVSSTHLAATAPAFQSGAVPDEDGEFTATAASLAPSESSSQSVSQSSRHGDTSSSLVGSSYSARTNGSRASVPEASGTQKLKEAFSPILAQSPDRASAKSSGSKPAKGIFGSGGRKASLSSMWAGRPLEDIPPMPAPIKTDFTELSNSIPANPVSSDMAPQTPPSTSMLAPVTTVTPPTPTALQPKNLPLPDIVASPEEVKGLPNPPPDTNLSSPGNIISHRRARSASAAHTPSKLSNSTLAPLAPTIEQTGISGLRNSWSNQPAGGFFSSVFSAAQNAASTLSNSLNVQSRTRTPDPQPEKPSKADREAEELRNLASESASEDKKELAVETLGMGDLSFRDLGIDPSMGGDVTTKGGTVLAKTDTNVRQNRSTVSQRDEMAARMEDMRAARAVSLAYEKPADVVAPSHSAEEPQPEPRPSAAFSGLGKDSGGEHTPPGGSVFDGEFGGSIKRSGSVRSRLASRRHRGSSSATGTTIGAMVSASLSGNTTTVPRLTGFAVASKKRNRDFHQLFRSVPEDDYLIEDYSCALQREILLAGRLYISEGHLCFSSNILGWVTTLVISFDEIMAIDKETTAMVFPNAIAIQTLHARHTFRSLLGRESTYDLMVNIWKISHPTLKSSVNGTQVDQGTGDAAEKAEESDAGTDGISDDGDEVYDEDEEGVASYVEAGDGSVAGSDRPESVKPANRKASMLPTPGPGAITPTPSLAPSNDAGAREKSGAAGPETRPEFPGPVTHPPTEFTDPVGVYDKLIKDDIIPAPLGRVYSMVFGPASGAFMTRFFIDEQKVTELQLEDDKKGLTNENTTRSYSYIKPLNSSIGPKQTKCLTTENLDVLDLDKAVLVTLTTQTPDVPSGNVFCVKTKYLFTWAPANSTRFYMTCAIEWTGKSWLKGPIEKGATDGQLSFGTDLVRVLKAGVAPSSRKAGASKGAAKGGKGKRTRSNTAGIDAAAAAKAALEASKRAEVSWGILEPLREPLSPFLDVFRPFWNGNVVVVVICILLFMLWFRTTSQPYPLSSGVGPHLLSVPQRMVAYEELWQKEESELWDWLEERVGMAGLTFPVGDDGQRSNSKPNPQHHQIQSQMELEARLRNEKMTEREMENAIRVTQQHLEALQQIVENRKQKRMESEEDIQVGRRR